MLNSFYTAGISAFNHKQYEQAQVLFQKASAENPEHPEGHFYLGQCLFLSNKKGEAIASLNTFISLSQSPGNDAANVPYAYDLLGQCYEAMNQAAKALDCYQTATKINKDCASAWHNMGLLHMKSAKRYTESNQKTSIKCFTEAFACIQKALALCSDHPIFLHSIASWYEHYIEVLKDAVEISNHFDKAIEYYRAALSLCKDEPIALKNIILSNLTECLAQYGHHLYRNGDYITAKVFYLEALQFDPEHLIVINQMGMSLFKEGFYSDARSYFTSILKKTDESQEVADAWLNIACTYRLEKCWDEAEKALTQASAYAPEDPAIADEKISLLNAKKTAMNISGTQRFFDSSRGTSSYTEHSSITFNP
ncbi:tetratricopeptide repeat protein [Legionella impletisoli]|nr:tetratricopeptide repeat protein [Legionella impletisoli]